MRKARALLLLFLLGTFWRAYAKPVVAPTAVLTRVRAAHRIFVSNAGEDDNLRYTATFRGEGVGYLLLYQQLVNWPGVQLVDSPAQADLIFQMYIDSYLDPFGKDLTVTFHLTILDPATQEVIWSNNSSDVPGALKPILPRKPAPHAGKLFAPLPAQLKDPQKLFLQLPQPQQTGTTEASAAFSKALISSGKYTFVDAPAQADLILSITLDNSISIYKSNLGSFRVSILDPRTKTVLWNFNNRFIFGKTITPEEQIAQSTPYFVQSWNGLIGKDSFSCYSHFIFNKCSMK